MTHKTTVMLAGISGVGKTTFLNRLKSELSFQHLTAGSLISAAKEAKKNERDELRLSDIDENQRLLIQGLSLARDRYSPLIILDGHVVIHTASGLEAINSEVFRALGINAILHLVGTAEQILENRTREIGRNRPLLSLQELEDHQSFSILTASTLSRTLDIPWLKVTSADSSLVKTFLSHVKESCS